MIILAEPYVSEFLQQTVITLRIPVLSTPFSRSLEGSSQMNMVEEKSFAASLQENPLPLLYSNSENATEWLNLHCPDLEITRNVNLFKDKSRMRDLFATLNPDVWYRSCSLQELEKLEVNLLPKPFVVKPARGFASIGIHLVRNDADWPIALELIKKEVVLMQQVFPESVVSLNNFLIERYIEGTEIAIDAYFNATGEPVILNILTHLFASPSDTSDRLYLTSAEIVRFFHGPVMDYLQQVAALTGLKNFPFHFEMKRDPQGRFAPIEINPMRFMGFCVADVEHYFYGINPYEYYFHQRRPDWNSILGPREGKLYGMFGIDIPKHLDKQKIRFNYDRFIAHFSKPLHYLKMDYTRFPMAIYLFAEVPEEGYREFESILFSDLDEFIDIEK